MRGWEPHIVRSTGSGISVWKMSEGRQEHSVLHRLRQAPRHRAQQAQRESRAGQGQSLPSEHSITILHAQKAGALTALLWPEEGREGVSQIQLIIAGV